MWWEATGMPRILGIDLGTTNSLCATFEDGQPKLIPNVQGSVLTPSLVGVLADGQVLVGAAARELRVTRPQSCAWCFKRWMGTDREAELNGRKFSAVELSSLVLRSLRHDAEAWYGESVEDAVITVPAYFNDHQRKATRLAGQLAGLNVRRIVNEPTAAALTYGFHDRHARKKLIVIDLGGGTFDVTAMEIFEGTVEIIATAGESFLGGEDFTDRLVSWALARQGRQLETAELRQPLLVARLREECERAKRALYSEERMEIRVPDERGDFAPSATRFELTREDFLALVQPLMERLTRPIAQAVRDARCQPQDFDEVILVGGATRMLPVRDYAAELFRREPMCRHNPDEVVALGAAVQAALIADDAAVEDMLMTDVCPFTLGIAVAKEFGHEHVGGYYLPIIERNTTIPVSREQTVSTLRPNQVSMTIDVYQGESRKVKDNVLLGTLKVTGIPSGPAGQNVQVRLTYDLNGLLELEAVVQSTGQKFHAVFTRHAGDLTPRQIADAIREIQALKFYGGDDVINRQLVLFAERVVSEVAPYERQSLDEAVDQFEQAMSSGDRLFFEGARQALLLLLSTAGHPFQGEGESGQPWN
jgi:molecular chaperone HscC